MSRRRSRVRPFELPPSTIGPCDCQASRDPRASTARCNNLRHGQLPTSVIDLDERECHVLVMNVKLGQTHLQEVGMQDHSQCARQRRAARRRNFHSLRQGPCGIEDLFVLLRPRRIVGRRSSVSRLRYLNQRCSARTKSSDLDDWKVDTRFLLGDTLTRQPHMQNRHFRVHGKLTNSDHVMNQTF